MAIHRFWKWAAVLVPAAAVFIVVIIFQTRSKQETDQSSLLNAGAAHLETIRSGNSLLLNEDYSSDQAELAFLEESSNESSSIDLLHDEQRGNPVDSNPRADQSARARPTELPVQESVPAVPLLSPSQRKANTAAIRKVYPDATDEQIEFWLEETRGLPPEMIREMLRLRDEIGPLARGFEIKSPVHVPELKLPLDPSLRALREARAIVLDNLANSESIGHLQAEIQFVHDWSAEGQQELKIADRSLSTDRGRLIETREPLDITFERSLFLQVNHNGQDYVTRYGHLKIGADGHLQLAIEGSEIVVSPGIAIATDGEEIRISPQGEVQTRKNQTAEWTSLGVLSLVSIAHPKYLIPAGNALYRPTERSGKPRAIQTEQRIEAIKPGTLELSNVDWDREQQRLKRLDWLLEQYER